MECKKSIILHAILNVKQHIHACEVFELFVFVKYCRIFHISCMNTWISHVIEACWFLVSAMFTDLTAAKSGSCCPVCFVVLVSLFDLFKIKKHQSMSESYQISILCFDIWHWELHLHKHLIRHEKHRHTCGSALSRRVCYCIVQHEFNMNQHVHSRHLWF